MDNHLYILHLFGNTPFEKINVVCRERHSNLLIQLQEQNITEYTIIQGEYDPINTKKSINIGHKKIVKIAKDLGLKSVNIMEDDCVFTSKNSWQYFLSQIPADYNLFTALIYNGEVDNENRIKNGMSGTHTLYNLHNSMFDFVLSQPDDVHCDRHAGQFACDFKYYVCNPMCVIQRGGYSFNLAKTMYYDEYLRDKVMYNG